MKKVFLFGFLILGFLVSTIACSSKHFSPVAPGSNSTIKAKDVPQSPVPTFTPGPQSACFSSANSGYPLVTETYACATSPGGILDGTTVSTTQIPYLIFCPCGGCGGCQREDLNCAGQVIIPAGTYNFTGPFIIPGNISQVISGNSNQVQISISAGSGGMGNSIATLINGVPYTGGFTYDFTLNQVVGNPTSPIHLTPGGNSATFVDTFDGGLYSQMEMNWNICVGWTGQPLSRSE